MKAREMVGQLLVFGFSGSGDSPELRRLLKNFQPGGLILFASNYAGPSELADLSGALNRDRKEPPLLLLVDQEGGAVNRFSRPFTHFPGNEAFLRLEPRLGREDPSPARGRKRGRPRKAPELTARTIPDYSGYDRRVRKAVKLAYRQGEAQARELRALGVHWNLSPVLDLANPRSRVLAKRCLGKSPEWVSEVGLAMIAGLQDNGVLACGKHFPGHGAADEDSHVTLPRVGLPAEEVLKKHLKPFTRAITNGLKTLMTAHVVYPGLDARHPATLSPRIVGKILRETIGFNGLVLTDDLGMQAIKENYGVGPASVMAFQAGADLLMVAKNPEDQGQAYESLVRAAEKGEIEADRLGLSCQRILRAKKSLRSFLPLAPKEWKKVLSAREHKKLAREIQELADELSGSG